ILRRPANEFVKDFIGEKRLQQATEIPDVQDVMMKKPATIFPSRGLATAMRMMKQRQVDSLVVVDDQNYVKGYVSIYDINRAFEDENKTVQEVLQPFEQVLSPDDIITDAIHIIDEEGISYIPVVDKDGKLLGLLTRGSVVGHVRDVYAQERWTNHV